MGSRLFMVLREKNGLTYTSSATTEYYEPGGDFTIYTEVDRRKILKNGSKPGVLPLIMGIIGDLVKNGVSEEELTRIKDNLQAKRSMALEDSNVQTSHNGRDWLLYGDPDKIVPYADMYSTYTAPITRKQILEVVRKYFVRANMVVCMMGDGLPTLESVKAVCDKGVF
jgi:predicted Zn-dependent peptidase